jgi:glycosyltransferase involved in cell wall biosynthesis
MPVFNEEGGIRDFVSELNLIFKNVNMKIFIVDDFSTDNTPNILTELEITTIIIVLQTPYISPAFDSIIFKMINTSNVTFYTKFISIFEWMD